MSEKDWHEEYRKCLESPAYFYENYWMIDGKKPEPIPEWQRQNFDLLFGALDRALAAGKSLFDLRGRGRPDSIMPLFDDSEIPATTPKPRRTFIGKSNWFKDSLIDYVNQQPGAVLVVEREMPPPEKIIVGGHPEKFWQKWPELMKKFESDIRNAPPKTFELSPFAHKILDEEIKKQDLIYKPTPLPETKKKKRTRTQRKKRRK